MFSKNKILKIKKYYLNIYLNKIYFKKTKNNYNRYNIRTLSLTIAPFFGSILMSIVYYYEMQSIKLFWAFGTHRSLIR
jgi:hypothetical protein